MSASRETNERKQRGRGVRRGQHGRSENPEPRVPDDIRPFAQCASALCIVTIY